MRTNSAAHDRKDGRFAVHALFARICTNWDLSGIDFLTETICRPDPGTYLGKEEENYHGIGVWDGAGPFLVRANFIGTDLTHSNLSEANLYEAHFMDARLSHALLARANLRKASFLDACLDDADLRGASMSEASLHTYCHEHQPKQNRITHPDIDAFQNGHYCRAWMRR